MSTSATAVTNPNAAMKLTDLRRFMEKKLEVKINGNRVVSGTLRGYDSFMNLVLENTYHIISTTERKEIGTVVIRGSSIVMWECLDKAAI